MGIAVDHRRRNRSEESLALNKERLQAYLDRLVLLPKNSTEGKQVSLDKAFPIVNDKSVEPARKIAPSERDAAAFKTLRKGWSMQRYAGIRAKRAAEKAEATETKEKK